MIADVQKMPSAESMKTFDTLIKDLKEGSPSKPRKLDDDRECKIVHLTVRFFIVSQIAAQKIILETKVNIKTYYETLKSYVVRICKNKNN